MMSVSAAARVSKSVTLPRNVKVPLWYRLEEVPLTLRTARSRSDRKKVGRKISQEIGIGVKWGGGYAMTLKTGPGDWDRTHTTATFRCQLPAMRERELPRTQPQPYQLVLN